MTTAFVRQQKAGIRGNVESSLPWILTHVLVFSSAALTIKVAATGVPVLKQIFARSLVTMTILLRSAMGPFASTAAGVRSKK